MHTIAWPGVTRSVASVGQRLRVLLDGGLVSTDISPSYGFTFSPGASGPLAGLFDDAVAMDATNGQRVYVADSDRVRLFSEDGRLLQTLAIESIDRPSIGAPEARSPGEVAGVAAGPGSSVFVSESTRGTIQVWEGGSVTDVFADVGQPGALAVSGRRLYVLDAASGDVRVLDTAGAPLATWDASDLGGAISVAVVGDEILVLGAGGAALTRQDGARLWHVDIESAEPLVGATIHRGWLVAATRRGLTLLGRVPPETP